MVNSPAQASLLLVDDDPSVIQVLRRMLSNYSTIRFATNGTDAIRLCRESAPDLILLDAQMGDMSGLKVCETLKADTALSHIPVIFVSSLQEAELERAVLEMGAVDFIRKPFNAPQVTARVNTQLKLKRLTDELRESSRIDLLTGIANQRAYDETLRRESLRALEAGQSLSLVLLEVDFFDTFTSAHGDKAADASLAQIAAVVGQHARRPGDHVARLDTPRFAMILPDTPVDGGLHVAHRVLAAVEALDIAHSQSSASRHLTCSAGVACFNAATPGEAQLLREGDARGALTAVALAGLSQAVAVGRAQAAHGVVPHGAAGPAGMPDPV